MDAVFPKESNVRRLLTLLAACTKDEYLLSKIVQERLQASPQYKVLQQVNDYDFLTEQAVNIKTRMQGFSLPENANVAQCYQAFDQLEGLIREFNTLKEESEKNAGLSIGSSYQPIHIISKGVLADLVREKRQALENSAEYRIWQGRHGYVFLNDETRQLEKDMNAFQCRADSLPEIHDSYQQLRSLATRFKNGNNNNGIITTEEHRKRQSAKNIAQLKKVVKYALIIGAILGIGGAIRHYWDNIVSFFSSALTWIAACVICGIIGKLTED